MSYQRKLTVANTFGKINALAIPEGDEKWLVRIFGRVSSSKDGIPSPYGDAVALIGTFKWVNLDTGEEFQSNRAYVPGVLLDQVLGQMSPENSFVEFVCDLGVKRSTKGSMGYEYVIKPHVDPTGAVDPLAALEAKFATSKQAKHLTAPAAQAPAKAPAKASGGKRR